MRTSARLDVKAAQARRWDVPPLSAITKAALATFLGMLLLSCGGGPSSSPRGTQTPSSASILFPTRVSPVPPPTSTAASPTNTALNLSASATPGVTRNAGPVTPSAPPREASLTPTMTATAVAAPAPARTQSRLVARLDQQRHHVSVSQTVTIVNDSGVVLADLLFVVEPNRQPGVFRLNSLTWAGGQPVDTFTLEGARLSVSLPQPLEKGEFIGLNLSFELDLPARAGPFGTTGRQTNLGDWYPTLPPYRESDGWLARKPALVGEHLAYDVADYQVEIQLLGPAADSTIAASGLIGGGEGSYLYRLEAARGFACSVSSEYVPLSETVGSTTVTSYVFPEHIAAGEAVLRTTAEALALYQELFAPYAHSDLAVVEGHFADGMEYDGLYFLGSEYYAAYGGSPQGYLTAIAAHETAHQWWYGLVGNDQALEPWLDETLAIYSELLYYERLYPDLVDWWWEFRVQRFNPRGWVNSTIYEHGGFRSYVDAVYLRGALFLRDLRELVGDGAFLAFVQDYAARNSGRQATSEDFFAILAEHTTADLRPLIRAYFDAME